jgi:hypothetical protein
MFVIVDLQTIFHTAEVATAWLMRVSCEKIMCTQVVYTQTGLTMNGVLRIC